MQSRSKLHRKGGMIMSAPLKNNNCIAAIFDSYVKTVMRNECRNAADEASYFCVTSRTIRNWRKKAFTAIRRCYERGFYEKE